MFATRAAFLGLTYSSHDYDMILTPPSVTPGCWKGPRMSESSLHQMYWRYILFLHIFTCGGCGRVGERVRAGQRTILFYQTIVLLCWSPKCIFSQEKIAVSVRLQWRCWRTLGKKPMYQGHSQPLWGYIMESGDRGLHVVQALQHTCLKQTLPWPCKSIVKRFHPVSTSLLWLSGDIMLAVGIMDTR